MFRKFVQLPVLAAALVVFCQAQAQVPAKHLSTPAPRVSTKGVSDPCYRKLSSTGRLTAYSVTVPPHGTTLLRAHADDYLLVALKKADLTLSGPYGNSFQFHLDDVGMQVVNGGWAHRVANLDGSDTVLVEIDVQGGIRSSRALCGLSSPECADTTFGKTDQGTYSRSTLFETPTVRLTRVSLGPGGVLEQHSHSGTDVLVPLTSAHLADDQGGITPLRLDVEVGDVRSFPAHTSHRMKNVGSEAVQFLEFERK